MKRGSIFCNGDSPPKALKRETIKLGDSQPKTLNRETIKLYRGSVASSIFLGKHDKFNDNETPAGTRVRESKLFKTKQEAEVVVEKTHNILLY